MIFSFLFENDGEFKLKSKRTDLTTMKIVNVHKETYSIKETKVTVIIYLVI